jgi:NAD(P)-dependent dehydrogenase (short-subunit alcohol dehydrogenase family)
VEDLTERVVVVTGATSGIGLAAALDLAQRGDRVALVGRDPARLADAASEMREASGAVAPTFRADFAVLDDVRKLADQLTVEYDRIDVLANNAGALVVRPVTTADGFELTMQTNHLAPFLLTSLLRDRVSRVVTTASGAHRWGSLDAANVGGALHRYRSMRAYGTSKQANILFTVEAARRWPDVLSVAFHPGAVRTRFWGDNRVVAWGMRYSPGLRSPAKGAETLVWLASTPAERLTSGGYYLDCTLRRPLGKATDPVLAAGLWDASAAAVGLG